MPRIDRSSGYISRYERSEKERSNKERQIREENQKRLQESISRNAPKIMDNLKKSARNQLNRAVADGYTFMGAAGGTYKTTKNPIKAVAAGVTAVSVVRSTEFADKVFKLGDKVFGGAN